MRSRSAHPLDDPIWTALTTRQQALAEGGALVRRYPPAIAPFAAMADMSPQSFAALQGLMSQTDLAVLFTPDPVTPPAEFKVMLAETGEQMTGTPAEISSRGVEIVTLGVDDVPEMIALTELTEPGPFSARTHELGTFLGIRIDGRRAYEARQLHRDNGGLRASIAPRPRLRANTSRRDFPPDRGAG